MDAEVWRTRREQLEEQRRQKAASLRASSLPPSASSNNVVAAPSSQPPRVSSSPPPPPPRPSTNFFSFQEEGFSAAPRAAASISPSSSETFAAASAAPAAAGRSFSADAASATEAEEAASEVEASTSLSSFSSSSAAAPAPVKTTKGKKASVVASEPNAFDVDSGAEAAAAPAQPKKKPAARKKATETSTTITAAKKRASKKAVAAAAAESSPYTTAESPLRALLLRAPPQPLPAEGPPPPPDVLVVDSLEEARRVAGRLLSVAREGSSTKRVWACDTEVADIDISKESPCGHGRVICFTVYGGEDVDFALSSAGSSSSSAAAGSAAALAVVAATKNNALKKSSLFVDTLLTRGADSLRSAEDEAEDAAAEAARAVYSTSAPLAADAEIAAISAAADGAGESGDSVGVEVSSSTSTATTATIFFDPFDFPESVNAAALAAADHARASALAARRLRERAAASAAEQVLSLFAPFFEDASIPKIWHNYSFDRHVLGNHGIDAKGFGGDTMHMARLLDSARGRIKGKGYSLESLSNDRSIMGNVWEKAQDNLHEGAAVAAAAAAASSSAEPKKKGAVAGSSAASAATAAAAAAAAPSGDDSVTRSKTSMKALFGARKLKKDGTPGKVVVLPPVEELQGSPASRGKWIRYASLDARCTYWLGRALEGRLRSVSCSPDAAIRGATGFGAPVADPPDASSPPRPFAMWDLYRNTWLPFGEILTDMEAEGVLVDREHLASAELAATADRAAAVARFRAWASARVPGTAFMNVCSGPQIRQLLFSGALRQDLFERGWDSEAREVVRAAVAAEEAAMRAEEEARRENAAALAAAEGGEAFPEIPPGVVFASASSSAAALYPDLPAGVTPVDAHLPSAAAAGDDLAFLVSGADDDRNPRGKEKPKLLELSRVFKAPNETGLIEPGKAAKKPKKTIDIRLHGLWGRAAPSPLRPPAFTPSGWPAVSTPVLRGLSGEPGAALRALAELDGGDGAAAALPPPVAEGADEAAARALLGSDGDEFGGGGGGGGGLFATVDEDGAPPPPPPKSQQQQQRNKNAPVPKGVGTLYSAFGGGREGLEASAAVDSLCELAAIDTLLSAFIVPLQGPTAATRVDHGDPASPLGRIHCSLNINTETGRLSARRPNLQNQPALEKDRYRVRRAFRASEGKTLIVADYGQLELRLLAHMANCESMIRAFEAGGDFHSRTALGMYDYIRREVDAGLCALEVGDDGGGDLPLIKDRYGSERRRAKVLNFSIAYGKTAHGLSRDWGVSLEEAQETVDRWYGDRPEVREWQVAMRQEAVSSGRVRTLLGRTRSLPEAASRVPSLRSHALRAAINTPIQGSAADVATAAMLSIARDPWLARRGWKLLLQVHDEVILEGPRESADEATARVVSLMERPFWGTNPLRVELAVDAKHADNWYEAK